MEKRLGEFIERVKNDFNLRCCGTKHDDWHFYLNLNDCIEFYKSGFVSSKRHMKSEIASSEFIIYVLIEAIASVKFFKGIDAYDNENFYKYLINNGYETLSYDSFNEDLDQWLYTEDYQMFINGYCLSKYIKENVVNGELKMFAQFVKHDDFYSRIVDYFSGEFTSSRGLRAYNNDYLAMCNNPISDFTQNVLSYGYKKAKHSSKFFPLNNSLDSIEENFKYSSKENNQIDIGISVDNNDLDEVSCEDGVSCERITNDVKSNEGVNYENTNLDNSILEENQISLIELDNEIEVSDIKLAFVDETDMLDNVVDEESFIEELNIKEEKFNYLIDEDSCEINEECSVKENIMVEQYTTTILDDSDEIYLFKVRFTEEEMELAETIINRSLKLFQIDLIENCDKFKIFTELSQYIVAANVVLGKILLLKESPFDAIKMNMYEAESIKYVLSKSKIKEHDASIRELYLRIENLFNSQTKIEFGKKDEYYKFINGKSNSAIMKIMFENK